MGARQGSAAENGTEEGAQQGERQQERRGVPLRVARVRTCEGVLEGWEIDCGSACLNAITTRR